MRIDEAYRVLEITPAATEEELKLAHRNLTKVWHPDRFAYDPALQSVAEQKLKAINEAYEMIQAARAGRSRWRPDPPPPPQPPPPETPQQRLRRLLGWMITCVVLGFFLLLRRPTPGGLLAALALFTVAALLLRKMGSGLKS